MTEIGVVEAKDQFGELLDRVALGEQIAIVQGWPGGSEADSWCGRYRYRAGAGCVRAN